MRHPIRIGGPFALTLHVILIRDGPPLAIWRWAGRVVWCVIGGEA